MVSQASSTNPHEVEAKVSLEDIARPCPQKQFGFVVVLYFIIPFLLFFPFLLSFILPLPFLLPFFLVCFFSELLKSGVELTDPAHILAPLSPLSSPLLQALTMHVA